MSKTERKNKIVGHRPTITKNNIFLPTITRGYIAHQQIKGCLGAGAHLLCIYIYLVVGHIYKVKIIIKQEHGNN